jgi:hypothetical protein
MSAVARSANDRITHPIITGYVIATPAAPELRAATYTGLPYREPEFVEPLERAVERSLRRLKPGRKLKERSAAVTVR